MCGLVGMWEQGQDAGNLRGRRLVSALRLIAHRGPDDEGVWESLDGQVLMGHRRLAIIDLSQAAHQPMISDDGRFVLVFNGEIYNFKSLRENPDLAALGDWRSQSDTEVLLRSLILWGTGALRRLDGMFALAVYDAEAKSLLLARDAFGEKPLFLANLGAKNWYFSSTITSLLQLMPFVPDLDEEAIALYWKQLAIASPGTVYKSVEAVMPGSWVRLSANGREDGVYWEPKYCAAQPIGFSEAVERSREALVRSLRSRLVSDVPLGCWLSGGVDSSLTTALTIRELGKDLHTFSVGFNGVRDTDYFHAESVAKRLGTNHHRLEIDAAALEDLPKIVWHLGQPFADFACVPTYHLARFSRTRVTVALTGDGGDEMYGGYPTVIANHIAGRIRRLVPRRLVHLARKLMFRYEKHDRGGWLRRMSLLTKMACIDSSHAYDVMNQPVGLSNRNDDAKARPTWRELHFDKNPQWPLYQRALYCDMRGRLSDWYLSKVDVASMAHSLETRTPFLSQEVFGTVRALNSSLLFRRYVSKAVLKKIGESYLPQDLLYRKKQGFTPPLGRWIMDRRYSETMQWMVNDSRLLHEWLDPNAVKQIWKEASYEGHNRDFELFGMLSFVLWWHIFVEKDLDPSVKLSLVYQAML